MPTSQPGRRHRRPVVQDKLDALATVTANLYHENIELKKKANRRQQNRLAVLTGGADPDN